MNNIYLVRFNIYLNRLLLQFIAFLFVYQISSGYVATHLRLKLVLNFLGDHSCKICLIIFAALSFFNNFDRIPDDNLFFTVASLCKT